MGTRQQLSEGHVLRDTQLKYQVPWVGRQIDGRQESAVSFANKIAEKRFTQRPNLQPLVLLMLLCFTSAASILSLCTLYVQTGEANKQRSVLAWN